MLLLLLLLLLLRAPAAASAATTTPQPLPQQQRAQHAVSVMGCLTLSILILANDGNQRRAVAAGGIEVAAAAMKSWHSSPNTACALLQQLLPPGNDGLAVCAGALEALQHHISSRTRGRADDLKVDTFNRNLLTTLQAAAQRHDAHPCADAGCRRCAHLRERGAMCALPGCCALRRESGKRLQRCIACTARYCEEAHLHDDWARHTGRSARRCGCAARRRRRRRPALLLRNDPLLKPPSSLTLRARRCLRCGPRGRRSGAIDEWTDVGWHATLRKEGSSVWAGVCACVACE
jgi:hypothetical protein